VGNWVAGAVLGVLSLFGLVLASRSHDGSLYVIGLLIFLVAVVLIFALVLRATRNPPRHDDLGPAREP
jgi:uncharacterized membrane protein YhhN